MLRFDEGEHLLKTFAIVARPEMPLLFAFSAGGLAALLTESLPIMDAMLRNERVATLFVAVSAVGTVDLCTPGFD